MTPTLQEAQAFFAELEAASQGARKVAAGSSDLSPWGDAAFASKPVGCVLHYTAGNSFRGSVQWLIDPKENAKASAHVVIGRTREAWADAFVKRDGLVDALRASVVQLRLPTQMSWHSTWANRTMFGIELVSCGEVRQKNGIVYGPNGNWSEKISEPCPLVYSAGRIWENYTAPQINTAVRVMQYYSALCGGFQRHNIITHEQAQGVRTPERLGCDKRDAGIWLDMASLRQCIVGTKDIGSFDLAPRPLPDAKLFQVATGSASQMEAQVAAQMDALGYSLITPAQVSWFSVPENKESLKIAQRMLGLLADGTVGPRSAEALAWRMSDRWKAAS